MGANSDDVLIQVEKEKHDGNQTILDLNERVGNINEAAQTNLKHLSEREDKVGNLGKMSNDLQISTSKFQKKATEVKKKNRRCYYMSIGVAGIIGLIAILYVLYKIF